MTAFVQRIEPLPFLYNIYYCKSCSYISNGKIPFRFVYNGFGAPKEMYFFFHFCFLINWFYAFIDSNFQLRFVIFVVFAFLDIFTFWNDFHRWTWNWIFFFKRGILNMQTIMHIIAVIYYFRNETNQYNEIIHW